MEHWLADLKRIAHVMIAPVLHPRTQYLSGCGQPSPTKQMETPHTDFGHSVKTMWLVYQIGKLTGDTALVGFAKPRAAAILKAAYLPDEGAWARRPMLDGHLDRDKGCVDIAELDQVAATLSLVDPYYANYLTTTWPFWMTYIVDQDHKEIWHWLDAKTLKPDLRYPRRSWKNAFHSSGCAHGVPDGPAVQRQAFRVALRVHLGGGAAGHPPLSLPRQDRRNPPTRDAGRSGPAGSSSSTFTNHPGGKIQ